MVLISEELPEAFWKEACKMFKCGFRNGKEKLYVAIVVGLFLK